MDDNGHDITESESSMMSNNELSKDIESKYGEVSLISSTLSI